MQPKVYRFRATDPYSGMSVGPERFIIVREYTDNRKIVDTVGDVGSDEFNALLEKTNLRTTAEFIGRAPTHEEYGTTDQYSYHYRKAVGMHPATFTELMDRNRVWAVDPRHVLRVVEFATQVGALDSLYRCLSNLACNADTVPVLSYDSPRSLFFQMVTAAEHDEQMRVAVYAPHKYTIPASPTGARYHGGVIAHQSSKDGSWDYAVHT